MLGSRLATKKRYVVCVILLQVLMIFFVVDLAKSQPRQITWNDLQALKNGKEPKNSVKELGGGMFSKSMLKVRVSTPRAQAASYADAAKENYIKLDSTIYFPDLFNKFIEVYVYNFSTSAAAVFLSSPKPEDIMQIERAVIVIKDDFFEPDSVRFHEQSFQNAYGADFTNVDAVFLFPFELFDGEHDIKIVVFSNKGKEERKLKKKDIKKLE